MDRLLGTTDCCVRAAYENSGWPRSVPVRVESPLKQNHHGTEKIRVGIIGANMRYGWGSDAHIPALSALPEFEITAVCTSHQETADETAKHFGVPHAFADP